QSAFWIAMMIIREPGAPGEAERERTFLDNPAILQSRVEFSNFTATVPGPGGDLRPLNFNLVLELHFQPEERRVGAARPTPAQIEVFRTVVVQLESKVRDHLNTFLTGQSFTNLMGERGPELVKAEVMRFINNELERYDFTALRVPAEISRRRVTNVLLPSWTLV
ncbi:MAG: flagellar basal body-associated FliL family protein, partial [Planctomycetes bacterium]|nr:flagellar basal body-associated FliL family protein [Planctomycetota bacterium]